MKGYTFPRSFSTKIRIIGSTMQDFKKVITPINTHAEKIRTVYTIPLYLYETQELALLVESADAFMTALADTYRQYKQTVFTDDLVVTAVYSNRLHRFSQFHIVPVERKELNTIFVPQLSDLDVHRIVAETIEAREQAKAFELPQPRTEADFRFSEWDCTHS